MRRRTPLLLGALIIACGDPDDMDESPTALESPGTQSLTPDTSPQGPTSSPNDTEDDDLPPPTPTLLPEGESLVLVPDNQTNRYLIIDPRAERVVSWVDLAELDSSLCAQSKMGCFIFGGTHETREGHDVLDLAYGLQGTSGLGAGFEGRIDRVRLAAPPELVWRLERLDFSALPGGAGLYCGADEEDPCRSDPSAQEPWQALCRVGDAHDFAVLEDDPDAGIAEVLVADTDTFRFYIARLDYKANSTCGKVIAFVDGTRNPDWPATGQPNNVVPFTFEDRELFLITFRASTTNHNGSGLLQLWELLPSSEFVWHWTFPEQVEGEALRFFRQSHGGELIPEGVPGGSLFRFADSAGLAESDSYSGNNPPGGKTPVLLLTDPLSPPDYLHDLYQPPELELWGYPRAITRVGDGTLLLTDSGCQAAGSCPNPARLIFFDDVETENSSKEGYWAPGLSESELLDQTPHVRKILTCGLVNPYWAQVIPPEAFGEELGNLSPDSGLACP